MRKQMAPLMFFTYPSAWDRHVRQNVTLLISVKESRNSSQHRCSLEANSMVFRPCIYIGIGFLTESTPKHKPLDFGQDDRSRNPPISMLYHTRQAPILS